MKKITFLLFLSVTLLAKAQIPSYYDDVNLSLSGTSLKNELATKITATHTRFLSYSQVWSASQITDLDPNDASQNNVILIYGYNDNDGNYITDRTRNKNLNGGTAGTDWNREHTYPKSLGNPNLGTSGPGADAHHLRPADVSFNGQRGSKKFAAGSGNAGDSNGGWYPGDEWKGDVARMMMYVYLRYGNQCLPTAVGIGSSSNTPDAMIDLFLQWNAEDPVSQIEINRNAYHGLTANSFSQGNRNPFIDNPAFATQIWGGPQAEDLFGGTNTSDTEAPSTPNNLIASNITATSVDLSWNASSDNIGVTGYDIYSNGTFYVSVNTNSYSATDLTASTLYNFTVRAKDAAGNSSSSSASAIITTLPTTNGGTTTELLISEYVEGSSNNKAIEIANFTGATVNLSNYSLKRNTNGGSSWGAAYNLSGQLNTGDVFVIVNSNAGTALKNLANVTTSAEALTFNGNDPVGLFKNNVLIDVIGNFNGGSANFAQNTTRRRKETITSPSTNYTVSEWDSYAADTFDGLGNHSIAGGTTEDTSAPTVPNGLNASNITETTVDLSWSLATDNVGVTGYDIYKNGTLEASTTGTNYTVTGLDVVTSYNFYIVAKDGAGNTSAPSTTITVITVDDTAPNAPSNLAASNTTQTTTDLTWNVSTDNVGVTNYTIFKDGVLEASTTSNSYTVSNLISNTNYSFEVVANDAASNSSIASNIVSVTTLSATNTSTLLLDNSFETGLEGWIDGGGDCYRIRSSRSYDGSYSVRIRDNSGTASSMTSSSFDVSGYTDLSVEFYFYSYSMENNEDFWLRYYDGSAWRTVETFISGTDFSNNGFFTATVNISSTDYYFPSNAQFRFQCDASSNADQIYIDKVSVTATTGSNLKSTENSTIISIGLPRAETALNYREIESLEFYPNPTKNKAKIRTEIDIEDDIVNVQLKLVDLQGRLVKSLNFEDIKNELFEYDLDVSNISRGVYLINIVSSKGLSITKKLIVE